MTGNMKVSIMTDIGKLEFTERPIPQPKDNEVLVKLEYVGICGSDIHYFENGRIGDKIVKPPFVLGHEASGTVMETGANVTNLKIGDRVALEPGTTCGNCEFCRKGKYNLCPDVVFFATPPVDGVFQEYATHEAVKCFKLPDNVSTLEGAMIEPLAIGFHAAKQGGAEVGQTAIVFGAGCIGLVSMLALKAMGVSKVIVSDVLDNRLEKALQLGADEVINGAKENVIEVLANEGIDLAIDTSGSEVAVNTAVQVVKKGANIVLVGYSGSGSSNLLTSQITNKELTINTVFRYRHAYPMTIAAVAAGKVPLKGLVSDIFDFDDLQNAMEQCANHKDKIVKAAVKL